RHAGRCPAVRRDRLPGGGGAVHQPVRDGRRHPARGTPAPDDGGFVEEKTWRQPPRSPVRSRVGGGFGTRRCPTPRRAVTARPTRIATSPTTPCSSTRPACCPRARCGTPPTCCGRARRQRRWPAT